MPLNVDDEDEINKVWENVFRTIQKSSKLTAFSTELKHLRHHEIVVRTVQKWSTEITSVMSNIFKAKSVTLDLRHRRLGSMFEAIKEGSSILMDSLNNNLDEVEGLTKPTDNTEGNNIPLSEPASETNVRRNISKPQLEFVEPVDNSTKPFLPSLQDKPHSLKPLAMLLSVDSYGNEYFPHPYAYELQHFIVPEHQLESVDPIKYPILETTPLIMVEDGQSFRAMIQDLLKYTEISVDIEAHNMRTYQWLICLLQISTRDQDYIVDILKLKKIPGLNLWDLNEVFANPKILKVFHGADYDIEWLQLAMSVYVVNMFDTHQAAVTLDYSRRSLAALLERHCSVVPDKQYQKYDWRIRPLTDPLINYARCDTHYLLYVYDVMRNDLIEASSDENLLHTVYEKSTSICEKRYEKPMLSPSGHLQLLRRSRKVFNSRQLYALKHLFAWRDDVARREDESTQFILSDRLLLAIASTLPTKVEGILACCNPIPIYVKQERLAMFAILQDAIQKPLEHVEVNVIERKNRIEEYQVEYERVTSRYDYTHVDQARRDLPTLLSAAQIADDVSSLRQDKSSSFWTKLKPKAVPAVENFMTPYQRYTTYMEMKPLIEQSVRNKNSTTEERVAKFLKYMRSMAPPESELMVSDSEESEDEKFQPLAVEEVKIEQIIMPENSQSVEPSKKLVPLRQRIIKENASEAKKERKRKKHEKFAARKKSKNMNVTEYDYSQEDVSIFDSNSTQDQKIKKEQVVIETAFKGNTRGTSTGSKKSGIRSDAFKMPKLEK